MLDCNFLNGSYNLCQKLRFCDGTSWLLRMPIIGSVCDEYADEKIAVEVEVLSLLRDSNVPVPGIIAWGLTAANPLGLGPYIVMDFIEGVSVNTLLRQQHNTRLLRDDICDDDVKFLYRQFARILLQLFQIDFPMLGSLPTPVTGFNAPVRPLTFKAHDILQTGGVDTFGMAFLILVLCFFVPVFVFAILAAIPSLA
jgi:aminoglycoside phosphotransferase (APT) family kinase protein